MERKVAQLYGGALVKGLGQGQLWKQGGRRAGCPSIQRLLAESPLSWLWER